MFYCLKTTRNEFQRQALDERLAWAAEQNTIPSQPLQNSSWHEVASPPTKKQTQLIQGITSSKTPTHDQHIKIQTPKLLL
jgi:hypothetical protein